MKKKGKKLVAMFTAFCTAAGTTAFPAFDVKAAYIQEDAAFISFTDTQAVWEKGLDTGYSIEGTTVTVSAAGTYVFSGSCADGSIQVKKGTTGVVLVLDGLELTSATTAPILCKAATETEIVANEGTINTITDSTANAEEKAAIKVNKQSSLVLSGEGTLNVNGLYKNGIKGGAETDITVSEQTLHVEAVDNGLASDNSVTVKSGNITVTAGGDGIKSSPDEDDTVSVGDITLESGEINITAAADGIQGDNDVTINGGAYHITTNGGYTTTLADDADSCKGIKAENTLTIHEGSFQIDSADDAVHSNQYINIQGGSFEISTGDDGMHADTSLIVGSEDGTASPEITITNCYEGLEAGTVYINSGDIHVQSTDDGINAAGGNDGSGNNGGFGGDGFNPGGGMPGGPGGGMPGGRSVSSTYGAAEESSTAEYAININGGTIYVKAEGDGLDANGDIYINGGDMVIYGAAAGSQTSDNAPFDCDNAFVITGGTVFGAGSSQMAESPSLATTQKYLLSKNTYSQGKIINIVDGAGEPIYTTTLAENVNYILYSSPEMESTGSYSIKTGTIAVKTDVAKCDVTLSSEEYTYDGTAKEPEVTVSCGETTLKQGRDYTVSYQNNVKAGTASVVITGINSYKGETQKTFTIQKAVQTITLSDTSVTKIYGEAAFSINAAADGTLTYASSNPSVAAVNNAGLVTIKGTGKAVLTVKAERENYETATAELTVYVKPAKTGNLSGNAVNTKKIKLSWNKVTGAEGYQIYRYDSSKKSYRLVKTITSGNTTSFTDSSLSSGNTYKYKVRAYITIDGEKYYGAYSKVVSAAAKPAKCAVKSLTAKKSSLTLKWKKTAGSGYQICYSTKKDFSSGVKKVKVSGSSRTSKTIKNLKSKKTYYVKIRAYKTIGKTTCYGTWSKVKKIKTT